MAQIKVKYTTSSEEISVYNPLCKALGDPLRIEILKVLQKDFGAQNAIQTSEAKKK